MQFVQARWFRQGGNTPITRIVIHDMEFPEKLTAAEDIAAYFQRVERKASAHYCCDADSIVQCVRDEDGAYHAPPNQHSLGIELAGYAAQTTDDWLDDFGTRMLRDQAAPLVRGLAAKHGVPLRWLTVDEVRAGAHGITSHNNVSRAFGQSSHTDPGGNFPIDQFMAWVTQGDDDMALSPEDKQWITDLVYGIVSERIKTQVTTEGEAVNQTLKDLTWNIVTERIKTLVPGAGD